MTGGAEVPLVDCYDGAVHVGKLVFHDTGGALPANLVTASGVMYLRYRLSQFNDVINILRQEEPLFICSNPGDAFLCWLDTADAG
jgi:hypothetical protein